LIERVEVGGQEVLTIDQIFERLESIFFRRKALPADVEVHDAVSLFLAENRLDLENFFIGFLVRGHSVPVKK
jgi:hypothetical protein